MSKGEERWRFSTSTAIHGNFRGTEFRDIHDWLTALNAARGRKQRALWVTKLRLEKDEPVQGLYTFGPPRTGDCDFTGRFDAAFGDQPYRYVNNADVVSQVATRAVGFSHAGTFRHVDNGGREDDAVS